MLYAAGVFGTSSSKALIWLLAGGLSALIVSAFSFDWVSRATSEGCIDISPSLRVCAASDMAKLPNHGPVPVESDALNLQKGGIELRAARNEVIAFQLILIATEDTPSQVKVRARDLQGPGGARMTASRYIQFFVAHYVLTDPAGYTWGPRSDVLPWPDFYPDALIPFRSRCGEQETLVESVRVPSRDGPNQSLWIDLFVPRDQPAGEYAGGIELEANGQRVTVPLSVTVENVVLPDQPSVEAVGEIYAPYVQEGVGSDPGSPAWQEMAHCYQRLAHAHRMVFVERSNRFVGPIPGEPAREADTWTDYDRAFGPALSGELFAESTGYVGPGTGTPVAVWRTPWPQPYNGRLDEPLSESEIVRYERVARAWHEHVTRRGWDATHFFAYVFDEVDGPGPRGAGRNAASQRNYVAMTHEQMRRVQAALDRGAPDHRIDLLWTSHSTPAQWAGDEELDLVGVIRLWAPAAEAAPPAFLEERVSQGEGAWFYHGGHPHIGVHAINASGIDMRTWGLVAARYGLSGQLVWAVNLGDRDDPYNKPSYHPKDDRFGNGTMVYPGAMLDQIGFEPAPGPIPSMRLKAWRRGLQDAELVKLARIAGRGAEVDRLLREYFPAALADARGEATWPRDPAAWHQFRERLLALAASRATGASAAAGLAASDQ